MKRYVKKADALNLIPERKWMRLGTLVKEPHSVAAGEVISDLMAGHRCYDVGNSFVVCRTHSHDAFYKSVLD